MHNSCTHKHRTPVLRLNNAIVVKQSEHALNITTRCFYQQLVADSTGGNVRHLLQHIFFRPR